MGNKRQRANCDEDLERARCLGDLIHDRAPLFTRQFAEIPNAGCVKRRKTAGEESRSER